MTVLLISFFAASFFCHLGHDGSIKFWDVSSKKCLQTIPGLHASSVWSVSHHKLYKNMIASGGSDGCLRVLYS